MKIKALDPMTEKGMAFVDASLNLEFTNVDKNTDILYLHFGGIDRISAKVYPNLKYILCPCTNTRAIQKIPGVEIIYLDDKNYLREYVWSTAEHTVFMLMTLIKRTYRQLKGSNVGFVGFGRVGHQVADLLKGFDISWAIYDKGSSKQALYNIFKNCDVITVHLEENEQTMNLIDRSCFDVCEKQPIFINTSRASIVVASDLIDAYRDMKILAAGLDVMESYSEQEKEILSSLGRVFITPHVAGKSVKSREYTDLYVLEMLERYLRRNK